MPRSGRQPQIGLESRTCAVCGSSYQPYRLNVRACSKKCYRRLPDVVEGVRQHHAQPHIVERKNRARRDRWATEPDRLLRDLAYRLPRLYGITLAEYRERLAAQEGKCAICGKPPTEGGIRSAARLHVDHDHITGASRGLLCNRCNPGVGYFQNNIALLQAAIDYLRRYT